MNEDLKILFAEMPINTDNNPYLEFQAPKLVHNYGSRSVIAEKIWKNRKISEQTASIINNNIIDIDSQIDSAAYAMSFNIHDKIDIDLSKASTIQRERYSKLIEEYCSNNLVYDFSFI